MSYTKRILVTGGAGFIGSHVVALLVHTYPAYKVVVLDTLDYCSSLKNLEAVAGAPNYTFIKGSITSTDLVTYVLRGERIDTIIHFAAQTHVDNSFGNSLGFTETNVLGTHVLLEAARAAGVALFMHVSTDEVYGDGSAGLPSREDSPLDPTNPYAASKAGAEYLVKAYNRSFGLPTIITRGNNVYGPHQYPEKIVPKFIHRILRGLPLTLHGSGEHLRNYLYVEDVAHAFDVILHRGVPGDIYNIGGVNEFSSRRVAHDLLRAMGRVTAAEGSAEADAQEKKHILFVADRPFNDYSYRLDTSRLHALGWRERVDWREGLARTIDWNRRHAHHWLSYEIDGAIVAHPRRGLLPQEVIAGFAADTEDAAPDPASIPVPSTPLASARPSSAASSDTRGSDTRASTGAGVGAVWMPAGAARAPQLAMLPPSTASHVASAVPPSHEPAEARSTSVTAA